MQQSESMETITVDGVETTVDEQEFRRAATDTEAAQAILEHEKANGIEWGAPLQAPVFDQPLGSQLEEVVRGYLRTRYQLPDRWWETTE